MVFFGRRQCFYINAFRRLGSVMRKLGAHTYRRVEASLRLLCGLGLEGRAIMPTLLREMCGLVCCEENHFVWWDKETTRFLTAPQAEYDLGPVGSEWVTRCDGGASKFSNYRLVYPADQATTLHVLIGATGTDGRAVNPAAAGGRSGIQRLGEKTSGDAGIPYRPSLDNKPHRRTARTSRYG